MKRSKRLWILLAVCAGVFLAAFAVSRVEERAEKIRASGETVLAVDPETVTALSWQTGTESYSFRREEGWIYGEDENFPVSSDAVLERLEPFADLAAAFIIEEPESLADYGLKEPECIVTLETAEKTWEIRLGTTSAIDEQRYFSIGDGKVYLAQTDMRALFDAGLPEMIQNDTIPALENVTGIRVSGKEEFTVTYREDGNSLRQEDVYYAQKDGSQLPLDTDLVENFLNDIRYLTLEEYVTYHASDEELAACGLDDPEITAEVTYAPEEGQTEVFTISVSRDPAAETKEDAEEDAEETVNAYARIGQSGILYKISSSYGTRLAETGLDTLRHQEVFPGNFADVTRLEFTLDGNGYTLSCLTEAGETETDGDGNRVFRYQETEADTAGLEAALDGLTAVRFTDEVPTGKEELRLTATFASGETAALTLYRYDGENCLAVVDGEPLALVSRADAMKLVEAVYAIVL